MELQAGKIYKKSEIEYTRASNEDFSKIALLVSEFKAECDGLLFAEEDLKACPQSPGHPLSHLRVSLFDEESYVLLVQSHEELVGFLKFDRGQTSKSRHRGVLTMAIKQTHWGLGIGTGLLKELEVWAASKSIIRLELCVMETNKRAMRLYQKQGYLFEGQKHCAAFVNGRYVDGYLMAKILSEAV